MEEYPRWPDPEPERRERPIKIDVDARVDVHIHHHHHHAPKAVSSTLTFKGGSMASAASILVGQSIQAIYQEFDGPNGSGNVVPPSGAVAYSSDNPAVATVDPASGVLTVSAAAAAVSSTLTFGAPSAAAKLGVSAVDASGAVKGKAAVSK